MKKVAIHPIYGRTIYSMLKEDRPDYRFDHIGPSAMASNELLALIIGGDTAPGLVDGITAQFPTLLELSKASKADLMKVPGVGEKMAVRIKSVFEIAKRFAHELQAGEEKPRISCPADAAAHFFSKNGHADQEEFWVLMVDTRNQVIGSQMVYRGTLNSCVIRVGEVFKAAIKSDAAAVVVSHNHPSGDPSPSPEDIRVTRNIVQAGEMMGIEVLDHIIVTNNGRFTSLKERRLGF